MTDVPAIADRRAEALAAARTWIGTPYRHRASLRGAGADCLGLVRGVWRALYGVEPGPTPAYTPDWGETDAVERLWRAARLHLDETPVAEARPGDVLLVRMREGGAAKHLGVLGETAGGAATLVHAYSRRGVVESPLGPAWARRVVAAFRFPATVPGEPK
jgi:NlpC/P60 family putative phage cell wall peptidase